MWSQCYICLENIKLKTCLLPLLERNGCFAQSSVSGAVKNPEHFCYGEETMLAWQEGRLASDIVEEHKKLKEADIVIFQVKLLYIRNLISFNLFLLLLGACSS